jgi:Peptidase M66
MEVRTGSFYFPPVRGSGPLTQRSSFNFTRDIEEAIAGLSGYSIGYSPGDDHHIGRIQIQLSTEIDGDMATVVATFGVRDWSGNWDDDYTGTVSFTLLADLAVPTAPATRTDLTIMGMEFNQATQHFRSAQHLDSSNVGPDNSIRLVARKMTGVRVYVDYSPITGQAPIASLSGRLEVSTSIGSTTFTCTPLNTIVPRRDAQINRRDESHTLNFAIPEAWCQGELRLKCYLFDVANPAVHSQSAIRTIRFEALQPLSVFGVGVHYTGQNLNLTAPSQTDLVNTLGFVESVFPVGEALITGFTTIDFDADMQANIANGCGDGFNHLLDVLRDLRGDSSDIYYGLLPNGINSGSVGGCGGGGVGAAYVNAGATAAEEIGHAFGLAHAPCDNANRCGNPANPDGNYPHYSSYPSDSIGEIGFDPNTGDAMDPAATFDFMGYSGPAWVSPYTYENLMRRFPASSGTSASASAASFLRSAFVGPHKPTSLQRAEWIRVKNMTLFLGLLIERDRSVERQPSFHFPVYSRELGGCCTNLTLELLDEQGTTQVCQPLRCARTHCSCCGCQGADCWPKIIRQPVPMPEGASTLVVWEGKDRIYEERIPLPPEVQVTAQYDEKAREFEISWNANLPGQSRQSRPRGDQQVPPGLWFLVQWLDAPDTWRGLLPRTQEQKVRVPARLLDCKKELRLRVLATSGIATGMGECTVSIAEPPPPDDPKIILTGQTDKGELTLDRPRVVHVRVIDGFGRTVADPELLWTDEDGRELGRGRSLDLRLLPEHSAVLRSVALGLGRWAAERAWRVERLDTGGMLMAPLAPRLTFRQAIEIERSAKRGTKRKRGGSKQRNEFQRDEKEGE